MPKQLQKPSSIGPHQTNGADSYPPATDYPRQDSFSIHTVMETLFRNKWIVLSTFVLVFAAVAIYTFNQQPVYQSNATIYINRQGTEGVGAVVGGGMLSSSQIANELEILKSRRIAMQVAEKLIDMRYLPGTDQPITLVGTGNPAVLSVAEGVRGRISARPVTDGVDIIAITARSTIPQESALIADLYAEEFVEYSRTASRSRVSTAREFLSEVTERFSSELESAENDLTAFLQEESVVAPSEEASQLLGRVSELQSMQSQTQLEMGMVQAELRALEDQIDQIVPGLSDRLASSDDRVTESLKEKIAQLEFQVEQKYARNPSLRTNPSADATLGETLAEIEQLRRQVNERVGRQVESVIASGGGAVIDAQVDGSGLSNLAELRQQITQKEIQANGLQARLEMSGQQIARAQGRLSDIPRKDVILNRLQRSLTTREQLYLSLIEKLQEARIAEQSELGYVDILDEALVPRTPVSPRIPRNLASGAILGVLLGLGIAFMRNALDNKVRKPEDLEQRGFNVLSVAPDMKKVVEEDFGGQERITVDGHEYSTRLITLLNPLSPVAESYRRLRTSLHYSKLDKDVQVAMVTSSNPSEGKTVTALNLAIALAQSGRLTLYVDCDLRRPEGHRSMGISREPGLSDLLFDAADERLDNYRVEVDSYLHVLPAGRQVYNPAEVLGSRKMQRFLAKWRQEYDAIVIDTPPVLVVSDALSLAPTCDTTVFVCSAGETEFNALERSIEALSNVGADVAGILLNRFDPKQAYGGYRYGYSYDYYKYQYKYQYFSQD